MNVHWDDGPEALKLEEMLRGELPESGLCPACKGREVHMFFHRRRPARGGGWAWCSRCRRYLHATVSVPDWWQNLASIPDAALASRPSELDRYAEQIDAHVSRLLADRARRDQVRKQ
jgi:hypothetical protein